MHRKKTKFNHTPSVEPVPSTSYAGRSNAGGNSSTTFVNSTTKATKRRSDDHTDNPSKIPRSDPNLDIPSDVDSSGVKRTLAGTIYQSKLLALLVKRAKNKEYDFRLATELDAAGKFDDAVIKYKEPPESLKWTWRFFQAKHKLSDTKITISDLKSTSDKNPFSLQKYFLSFKGIKEHPLFKDGDLKDFVIITNTEVDFDEQKKYNKDGSQTQISLEQNRLVGDWSTYFDTETSLESEYMLFFDDSSFKAKKMKFNDNAKCKLKSFFKSTLKKFVEKFVEKSNESSKNSIVIKNVIDLLELEHKLSEAKIGILNRKEYECSEDEKKTILNRAKSIKAMKNDLGENDIFKDFETTIKELEKSKIKKNQKKIDGLIEKAKQSIQKVLKMAEQRVLILGDDLKKPKEDVSKVLKTRLSDFKRFKQSVFDSQTKEDISDLFEGDFLGNISKKSFQQKSYSVDFDKLKEWLDETFETEISYIYAVQLLFDLDKFDEYLTEFLDKFRLVVNYPNEIELSELIEDELGEEFGILNASLVSDSFEIEMISFLKQYDNGKAKFYSWRNADEFFAKMKRKISTLMIAGLSKNFLGELSEYRINFCEDLQIVNDFISNDIQILHIISSLTRLTTIKLFRILKKSGNFRNDDCIIAVDSKIFSREIMRKVFLNAFPLIFSNKVNCPTLYLIEFQSNVLTEDRYKEFVKSFSSTLRKHKTEKCIFITYNNISLQMFKNIKVSSINDEPNSFDRLDQVSQDHILSKMVRFQGKDVQLNQMVDKPIACKFIDEHHLLKLLDEETISIGDEKAFTSIGYVEDYYIERRFCPEHNPKTVISEKKLDEFKEKIIILTSEPGVGKSTVLTSVAKHMKYKIFENVWIVRINLNDYAIDKNVPMSLHNITFDENDIEKAIEFTSKMAIHGPDFDNGIQLQRKLFQLSMNNLIDDDERNCKRPKIIILFDGFDEISPTFKPNTTKLIHMLRGSSVHQLWATSRVHEKAHLVEEFGPSSYFLKPLTPGEQRRFLHSFWKWNLKFKYVNPGAIIKKEYDDILLYIKHINVDSLEPKSGPIKSHNLRKANTSLSADIRKIVNDFPGGAVDKIHDLEKAIDKLQWTTYAHILLDDWNKAMSTANKQFTHVALHLKMLSEVIFDEKFQLPKELGPLFLYEKFVNRKFSIYYEEKSNAERENEAVREVFGDDLELKKRFHKFLAVKILLEEKFEEIFPESGDFKKLQENTEKVTRYGLLVSNEREASKLDFVHRSFAEYFFVEYLIIDSAQNVKAQKITLQIIFSDDAKTTIRQFINEHLKKSTTKIAFTKIAQILKKMNDSDCQLVFEETVKQGHSETFEVLLENIQKNDKLLKRLMKMEYSPFAHALLLAIDHHQNEIAKLIINTARAFDKQIIKNLLNNAKCSKSVFVGAATSDNMKMLEFLFEFIENDIESYKQIVTDTLLHCNQSTGGNILFYALRESKNSDSISYLLNWVKEHLGPDVLIEIFLIFVKIVKNKKRKPKSDELKYAKFQTLLHYAIFSEINDKPNKVRAMVNAIGDSTLKDLMLRTDHSGLTVFNYYKKDNPEQLELLKFLANKLSIFSTSEIEDLAILSVYGNVCRNRSQTIEMLLKVFDVDSQMYVKLCDIRSDLDEVEGNRIALNNAFENADEIKNILNQCHNNLREIILTNDEMGWTILNKAIEHKIEIVVEHLLESVAQYPRILKEILVKVDKDNEETVLHHAAKKGYEKIIFKLLYHGRHSVGLNFVKKEILKYSKNVKTALKIAEDNKFEKVVNEISNYCFPKPIRSRKY